MSLPNKVKNFFNRTLTKIFNSNPPDEEQCRMVIENPLILDKILSHVLFSDDETRPLNRQDTCSLRLVCKSLVWDTNTPLYRKIRSYPLIYENRALLKLNISEKNINDLFRITQLFLSPHRVDTELIPPIQLKLESYIAASDQRVLDFLTVCGPGVVNLQILCSRNDNPQVLPDFPEYTPLALANLKTLECGNVCAGLPQLREVLRGATTLRSCTCRGYSNSLDDDLNDASQTFFNAVVESLSFPSSLEVLKFDLEGKGGAEMPWENLVQIFERNRNNLLGLKSLVLTKGYDFLRITGAHMRRILDALSTSLESLELYGWYPEEGAKNSIGLPEVMRNLRVLKVGRWESIDPIPSYWELDEEFANPQLGQRLPNLEAFSLFQCLNQFNLWTGRGARFPKVKSVEIYISNWDQNFGDFLTQEVSLIPDQIRAIYRTFPNLVELGLSVCGPQMDGLRCVMSELENLQSLSIKARYGRRPAGNGGLLWELIHLDAVILGVTPQVADQLKENRQRGEVILQPESPYPGICHLKNLKSLKLEVDFEFELATPEIIQAEEAKFLSDISFEYALLKMEKLKELTLFLKRHKVSQNTLKEWKERKGTEVWLYK